MYHRALLLIASYAFSACPQRQAGLPGVPSGGAQPTITPPTPDTMRASFQLNSDMYVSIDDSSYLADPSLVLGKVAVVESQNGDCAHGVFRITNERIIGVSEQNGSFTAIPKTPAVPPRLLGSHVVDQGLTANVSALSFLSAQVDAQSVLNVALSNLSVLRYDDSTPTYSRARDQWRASHRDMLTSPRYCRLLVIMGVVEQEWVIKKYTRTSGSANGGAFGVTVGGSAYSSDNSMQAIYRFGLSLDVLEEGPGPSTRDAGVATADTGAGRDGGASASVDASIVNGSTDSVNEPSGPLRELLDNVTRSSQTLRME